MIDRWQILRGFSGKGGECCRFTILVKDLKHAGIVFVAETTVDCMKLPK